mgnify:CR=1 FL=1
MLSPRAVVNNPPRFQGPIGVGVWLISVHTAMPFCAMVMKNCNVHLRLTPNPKKPNQKNPNTQANKKQHIRNKLANTLFPASTNVFFLTLILLLLSYSQGFVTTHSPSTPQLLFQQKPRQIFCLTRLPTKPQKKINLGPTVLIYNFQNDIIFPI